MTIFLNSIFNPNSSSFVHSNQLPLVNVILEMEKNDVFKDVLVIACQHLVKTSVIMFKHCFKSGLLPNNLFILGKCYSSDPQAARDLSSHGVTISPDSFAFDFKKTFDEQHTNYVENFLQNALLFYNPLRHKKIILIDDGGFLIAAVHHLKMDLDNFVGIEQTSAGINLLNKIDLKFSVVNVARSKLKLYFESPIVADTFILKLKKKLPNLNKLKTLIIGNGAIGKAVYHYLEKSQNVDKFDLKDNLSDFPQVELKKKLPFFDLIIGCTGSCCLPKELLKYVKKGAILASLSSSDREFPIHEYRNKLTETPGVHTDLELGPFTLLNCGFPLNFDEDFKTTDDHRFQLTRALITSGMLQALEMKKTKKMEFLSKKYQEIIYSHLKMKKNWNLIK